MAISNQDVVKTTILSVRLPITMMDSVKFEAQKRGLSPSMYVKTILYERFNAE